MVNHSSIWGSGSACYTTVAHSDTCHPWFRANCSRASNSKPTPHGFPHYPGSKPITRVPRQVTCASGTPRPHPQNQDDADTFCHPWRSEPLSRPQSKSLPREKNEPGLRVFLCALRVLFSAISAFKSLFPPLLQSDLSGPVPLPANSYKKALELTNFRSINYPVIRKFPD
jgi:hypothetical protein